MKNIVLLATVVVLVVLYSACSRQSGELSPDSYFKRPLPISPVTRTEKQDYVVDTLARGLDHPWSICFLPSGEVLITERAGKIRIIKEGRLLPDSIKGLPEIYVKGQGGLHDLELHPDYSKNGIVYIAYAAPGDNPEEGNTAVMMAKLDLETYTLVDGKEIFQALPYSNRGVHFGGRIVFDGNGHMYISTGDRGNRDENPQSLENHSGKIHRLNLDGSIPQDNPFVDTPGAIKSIFSYGHRNPQGLAFHPVTNELWEHEHAPKGGDELNICRAGLNYGWPVISYGINYDGTIFTEDTAREGMEQPVTYWKPSIAPCGMSFITSDKYPQWKHNVLVGSLKFRYVARVELEGESAVHEERLLENVGRVRAIEEGPDGYIYVATEEPGLLMRLFPVEDLSKKM
jgi:glucose/arabinose dehydrogenase